MAHHKNEEIVVYGIETCADTIRARAWLDEYRIPYVWIDVNTDRAGYDFVVKVNNGRRTIPTVLFGDGSILVEPTDEQLAAKLRT
jgi:glutaredoxin